MILLFKRLFMLEILATQSFYWMKMTWDSLDLVGM